MLARCMLIKYYERGAKKIIKEKDKSEEYHLYNTQISNNSMSIFYYSFLLIHTVRHMGTVKKCLSLSWYVDSIKIMISLHICAAALSIK